jgi:PKD repeat protein
MRRPTCLCLPLSITCILAGCGGGGSGSAGHPPAAVLGASATGGAAPLQIVFDASASFDPDGGAVHIRWDFGDGTAMETDALVTHTFTAAGRYDVILTATDAEGAESIDTLVVIVTGVAVCPDCAAPRQVGRVVDARVTECSGLAWSRTQPILWLHNDSGDSARFFGVGEDGTLRAVVQLTGATAQDWEDMAVGPYPSGGQAVFLADIGDNAESRTYVRIYRVPEPAVTIGATPADIAVDQYDSFKLYYPDRPHNAETFLVDPQTGDVYIVTKENDGHSSVFRAACPANGAAVTLTLVASLVFGAEPLPGSALATGGDVSPDGTRVLIRTYSHVFMFLRPDGDALAQAFAAPPHAMPAPPEGQGEAIAFSPDGWSYYTLSEGTSQWIYRSDCVAGDAP